ncbi:MAG: cAMP/cGMP-dependent 3',5'-cyclic-AMP/GMP phosphodiesterase [Spirochaetes bacterium]|nr:cAMP/cGMP-dependent 3',5'-cyclic-AMP/GMP phosphodiesterase [Spirochaetota bacterium]
MDIADQNIIKLNRGGYVVLTSAGPVQFGSPPETIKDTMKMSFGVPQIFVLPNNFFNWIKGISVAEVEFPIYYNYFIKKRKTYIICEREQAYRFKNVLHEAIFGPKNIRLDREFDQLKENVFKPDIKNEIEYFRNNMKLSDLVGFFIFNNNMVKLKNVTVRIEPDNNFTLSENEYLLANIPGDIQYIPKYDIGQRLKEPYIPPLFGITCLGPSHGFDPEQNTSGFIIWLNHKGIMVDPPVNSTEWLKDSNVSPKLVDSIILTHCHADHDAGTFQKILEEGVINVYTTKTVMHSFLRKYSAFANTSMKYLLKLFSFKPVKIGEPEFIHTAKFGFFYTLHSIPTIGFKMEYQDKSFSYSSDHNNDPALHKKLLDTGVINEARFNELISFPWESDVIYHESGIPPLHTPIKVLDSKSNEIKRKTVVYHISKKDFESNIAQDSALTLAKFGIEHTLNIDVMAPDYHKVYQALGVLNFIDIFDDMPLTKAQEFISIIKEEYYKKGDLIIKMGTAGDKFYVIASGNVSVETESDLEKRKIYGACDYFGEQALVTGNKRAADVIAETDVMLYTIEKDKFLNFIKGTEFEKTLINLARVRDSETWNILSTSFAFQILTSTQKTLFESMFHPVVFDTESEIIKENELFDSIYIIREGEVFVFKNNNKITSLKRGDFFGSMAKIYNKQPASFSFKINGNISLYKINAEDAIKFLEKYPGLQMKLTEEYSNYI